MMNVNSGALVRWQELDLHSSMASLNIREDNDRNNSSNRPQVPKEVLYNLGVRQTSSSEHKRKRRCQLKPTKLNRSLFTNYSVNYVKDLMYKQSSKLETIYEEPVAFKNDNAEPLSCVKAGRVDLRCRMKPLKAKMKKVHSYRVRLERKISMDEFISKFHEQGRKVTNESVDATDSALDITPSISYTNSSHNSAFYSNC